MIAKVEQTTTSSWRTRRSSLARCPTRPRRAAALRRAAAPPSRAVTAGGAATNQHYDLDPGSSGGSSTRCASTPPRCSSAGRHPWKQAQRSKLAWSPDVSAARGRAGARCRLRLGRPHPVHRGRVRLRDGGRLPGAPPSTPYIAARRGTWAGRHGPDPAGPLRGLRAPAGGFDAVTMLGSIVHMDGLDAVFHRPARAASGREALPVRELLSQRGRPPRFFDERRHRLHPPRDLRLGRPAAAVRTRHPPSEERASPSA